MSAIALYPRVSQVRWHVSAVHTMFMLLALGYLLMTRSFAHWGVPEYDLYIGELALVAVLLFRPAMILAPWLGSLAKPSALSGVAWWYSAFLLYGALQVARGFVLHYPSVRVLENFSFNYYPLFLFIGISLGLTSRVALPRMMQWLVWSSAVYGVLYILVLNRLGWSLPGREYVPFWGQPIGAYVAILAVLSFRNAAWPWLLANCFVVLAMQVRDEWAALATSVFFLSWITRRMGKLLSVGLATLLLVAFLAYADIKLPSPEGRGGEISANEIIGRAVASVDQKLASSYTDNAEVYAGTVSWRTEWWQNIWNSSFESPANFLMGHGYGFYLGGLVTYIDETLRSPHSVFFYVLGYTGWIGVVLFTGLYVSLAALLWRAYRLTGQPFGIAFLVASLCAGLFGNHFETPFGAIPFYLIAGLAAAPAVEATQQPPLA